MRKIEVVLEKLEDFKNQQVSIGGTKIKSIFPITHKSFEDYPVDAICNFEKFTLRFHQNLVDSDENLYVQIDLRHSDDKSKEFESECSEVLMKLEEKCFNETSSEHMWHKGLTIRESPYLSQK